MSGIDSIVGKTIKSVENQDWAGTDTFKDTVTWERMIVTFDDGSAPLVSDSWDGEVYDQYRCVFDDDGQPHRYVEETDACKHCGHGIGHDPVEGWVAPDAGFDVEGGDGQYRAICPDNSDFPNPEHEPDDTDRCTGCGRESLDCSKDPCPDVVADREATVPAPGPRDRLRNPSINWPESTEEAAQAIIHKARKMLFDVGADFNLTHHYATDSGLGTSRTQQQADWLNQQQSIIAAYLEDALDRIDFSAKDPIS